MGIWHHGTHSSTRAAAHVPTTQTLANWWTWYLQHATHDFIPLNRRRAAYRHLRRLLMEETGKNREMVAQFPLSREQLVVWIAQDINRELERAHWRGHANVPR